MSYKISKKYALSGPEGAAGKAAYKYIIVHDTGNDNNKGVNSGANEASYMKGHWQAAYTHFIVDDKAIYQVGTPGYVAWGAGSNANANSPMQVELAHVDSKARFKESYKRYIWLIRYYTDKYGIPNTLDAGGAGTSGVKSHKWVSDHIWGDHQDPYGYLAKWGISKSQFAKDIKNGIKTTSKPANSTYKVKKGDSWWSIANSHNTTVTKLTAANGKTTKSVIYPGDKIKLSGNAAATYKVKKGDGLWSIANHSKITVTKLCSLNGFTTKHVIHPGDKLKIK